VKAAVVAISRDIAEIAHHIKVPGSKNEQGTIDAVKNFTDYCAGNIPLAEDQRRIYSISFLNRS